MIIDLGFSPISLALIGLLLGAIIGSFLNVVVIRLPRIMEAQWTRDSREFLNLNPVDQPTLNLSKPGSHCPHCQNPIKPAHNIPILSFLFLRGRCHHCGASISPQYPIVEMLTAVVTAYYVMQFGISTTALASILFTYALIVLTLIDYREQLLPDQITLPLLWLGLLVNLSGLFTTPEDGIIGAALGYLCLWSVYWLFKLITGREGMGYGDFKLNAALGAWLGWQMVPVVILLASLLGMVVGCYGIFFAGRDRDAPLAFGPYLCIAGWIAMLWGDSISLYLF